MREFTYVVPRSLREAADQAAEPDTILKGAGLDLLDRMKERLVTPNRVVNLLPLREKLSGIVREPDGSLTIGALATLTELAEHETLAAPAWAGLRESAAVCATPQVRNRATVAGNLLQFTRCWYVRSEAHHCLHGGRGPICLAMNGDNRYHSIMGYADCVRAHPSNVAVPLLALGAEYSTLAGEKARRRPLAELFPELPRAEAPEHTLEPGEILTAIHLPPPAPGTRTWYAESREKLSFDWATTACAARIVLDGDTITEANLVLGAVAPVPMPRASAAAMLIGEKPGDDLFRKVAEEAFAIAAPLSHNAYKVPVGKAIVREALHGAVLQKTPR